jgi:hypothetical protein
MIRYVPALENTCVGFSKLEILSGPEAGSPKFHDQPVIVPPLIVEVFVNSVSELTQVGVAV